MSDKLTIKQQKFCKYYASSEESFANGVKSYAIAYSIDLGDEKQYKSAKSNACKLLANEKILGYINELLEEVNLNDAFVNKQLGFLIAQNQNLSVKRQAIADYYKFRSLVIPNRDFEDTNSPVSEAINSLEGEPILEEEKEALETILNIIDKRNVKIKNRST